MHHIAPGDEAEFGIDYRRKVIERRLIAATPGPQETRDFDRRSRRNVKPDTGIIQPGPEKFSRAVVVCESQSRLRTERVSACPQKNSLIGVGAMALRDCPSYLTPGPGA